jgi:Holliday junction DNA helicase RuvB
MDKNDLRPTTFDDFVGQEGIKSKMNIYIREAVLKHATLPHIFLASEPGFGKTSLAIIIAQAVGDPLFAFDLSTSSRGKLATLIRTFGGGIVLFDEIHRASKAQMESLLELLEEGFINTPGGGRIYAGWFTAIAATTEPQAIPQAILDRFSIRPEFEDYSDEEMVLIVEGMVGMVGSEMEPEVARVLGMASAGVPRQARNLVMAWDALSTGNDEKVTADEVLALCDVEADGLTKAHLKVLKALDRMDSTAGQAALCNILSMHPQTLFGLEKLLYRRDYIIFTPRGREMTTKGSARLRPASLNSSPRRIVAARLEAEGRV